MKNYSVTRGEKIIMVTQFDEHKDGTLWYRGTPLLDSQSPEFIAMGKDKLMALVNAKKWDEIPAGCYAHVGVNPSGLVVTDLNAVREAAMANRTPAQIERDRIEMLYIKANKLANSTSEDNVAGPMRIRAEADAALAKWRKDYPAEAAKEEAERLIALAEREEELAAGALVYDADGWITEDEQQHRHDEHMAKAGEYRTKAKEILKEA